MLRLRAGTIVPGGHYLSLSRQEIVTIEGPDGYLAGQAHETFLRVPSSLAAVGARVMGAVFFLSLPVVAFAVVAGAAVRTAGDLVRAVAPDFGTMRAPIEPRPGPSPRREPDGPRAARLPGAIPPGVLATGRGGLRDGPVAHT